MPKSSSDMPQPRRRSISTDCLTCSKSWAKAVSVISRSSRRASKLLFSMMPSRESTPSLELRSWAERLNDRRREGSHVAAEASAILRSGRVSEPTMPARSAMGKNWQGGTCPRTGLCQRASASNPAVLPSRISTIGWNTTESSFSISRCLSRCSTRASILICFSCSASNRTASPRRVFLAW
ncbi:hypothetical protein D3C86_1478660 [compost metagenome]